MGVDDYHFHLAVDGLTPNFKHYSFAVFGRRITVSIVPKPVVNTGGGAGRSLIPDDTQYEIVVVIEYKGKKWVERRSLSATMMNSFEKVHASFKYMHHISSIIAVNATYMSHKILNLISINIKRKSK